MSKGVFTRMKRITFVKGWLTGGTPVDGSVECGYHTSFPLEVTGVSTAEKMDKVAEIFYRTKFAQFAENTLGFSSPDIASGVVTGSVSPRVQFDTLSGGLHYNALMSGYWSLDDTGFSCAANSLPYHGNQYESLVAAEYFNTAFGPFNFRDIADDERGMWFPSVSDLESPLWSSISSVNYVDMGSFSFYTTGFSFYGNAEAQHFRTAFSWFSTSDAGTLSPPAIPIPYITDLFYFPDVIYENLQLLVQFSGMVAVVGDFNNFYASTNRLFVGMECRLTVGLDSEFATTNHRSAGFTAQSAEYIMRLSGGYDLSCPFEATDTLTGSIVHEATEWWPYAKDSPAVPVWDVLTGAKL